MLAKNVRDAADVLRLRPDLEKTVDKSFLFAYAE